MQFRHHRITYRAILGSFGIFLHLIIVSECNTHQQDWETAREITRQLGSNSGFGWGLTDTDQTVLNTFFDLTFHQCILKCNTRPRCKGLEYQPRQKYCKLVSNFGARERRAGFVSLTGFETLTNRQCDIDTCEDGEACIMSPATGQLECRIQECGSPLIDGYVFGNRYQIGSQLLAHLNDGGLQPLTCRETGTWEHGQERTYPGVTCSDIREYRLDVTSGIFLNKLNYKIYCEFEEEHSWMVFQRRQDGSENFYRPWSDYKNGFGDLTGEFWLGLEPLYRILETPGGSFTLQIDLENWAGDTAIATYTDFSITDETNNYRLSIDGFNSTDLNNSLIVSHGMEFSTLDRDNDDADGAHCAVGYKGGWWYKGCVYATLNGEYFTQGQNTEPGAGIIWKPWTSETESLKATTMKIRRN